MKKIRIGLIIIAIVLAIAELIILYYNNWTWAKHIAGAYIMLFVNICTIGSSILSAIYNRKNKKPPINALFTPYNKRKFSNMK